MFKIVKKFVGMETNGKKLAAVIVEALDKGYKTEGAAKTAIRKAGLDKSEVLADRSGFYCWDVIAG